MSTPINIMRSVLNSFSFSFITHGTIRRCLAKVQSPFILLIFAATVFAQGVRYDIPPILTSAGKPVSLPVISLCPGTATISGAACSPATGQSTTDITTSTLCPVGSPVTLTGLNTCQANGDTLGNAGFWLKPGAYIYCITGSGITGACYNLTVPTGVSSSGAALGTFSSGRPWLDVTGPPYNAKCDGVTDDSTALQSALTAANAGGFDLKLPNTGHLCAFGTTLVMDTFQNVSIIGAANSSGQPVAVASTGILPGLLWTGSGSGSAISVRSVLNVGLSGITIAYNNASFTGFLVDFSESTAQPSTNITIQGCAFTSQANIKTATALLYLDKTVNVWIIRDTFNWAVHAIRGMASGSSSAVVVNIISSLFNNQGGTGGNLSGAYIQNPGQGWTLDSDDFEMINTTNQNIIDGSLGGANALVLLNDWVGDTPAGYNGTLINLQVNNDSGVEISGGTYTGGSSALGTVIATPSAHAGLTIHGVRFTGWAAIVSQGGATDNTSTLIYGNSYTSVTAIHAGANPASGITSDLNGNAIFWCRGGGANPCQFLGTGGVFIGSTAPFTMQEGTAVPAIAGDDVCYADSTLHAVKCSYNNGTFFQLPQVITATSAAFATATTAGTCVQSTTAVTGAATTMAISVSPVSTPGVGAVWSAFVSSAGNVTINECAVATSAGGTIAFNIRVFP